MKNNFRSILAVLLIICVMASQSIIAFGATTTVSTPKIKSAISVDGTHIQIKWGKMSDISGLEVFRMNNEGNYKKIATLKAGRTTYNDYDVIPLHFYSYKVRAYKVVNGKKVYSKYACTHQKLYANESSFNDIKWELSLRIDGEKYDQEYYNRNWLYNPSCTSIIEVLNGDKVLNSFYVSTENPDIAAATVKDGKIVITPKGIGETGMFVSDGQSYMDCTIHISSDHLVSTLKSSPKITLKPTYSTKNIFRSKYSLQIMDSTRYKVYFDGKQTKDYKATIIHSNEGEPVFSTTVTDGVLKITSSQPEYYAKEILKITSNGKTTYFNMIAVVPYGFAIDINGNDTDYGFDLNYKQEGDYTLSNVYLDGVKALEFEVVSNNPEYVSAENVNGKLKVTLLKEGLEEFSITLKAPSGYEQTLYGWPWAED